ncbi:carbonic anhydrase 6-like [Musca autumnalis]|uniref:carbonic anhydrase 6-like n=1 Tax=Musca autumnalis TaxID=221902 RepID=UPI003CECB560
MNEFEKLKVLSILKVICLIFMFRIGNTFGSKGLIESDTKGNECYGKHSRPFDENSLEIQKRHFEPFAFERFDEEPIELKMSNTVDMLIIETTYTAEERPIVYGGPLKTFGNYGLEHVTWHWLEKTEPKNDFGDTKLPAELQLIFFNIKHRRFDRATNKPNGIIGLTFPLKVVQKPTLDIFQVIAQHLPMVREAGDSILLPKNALTLLGNICKGNLTEFYTYHSSSLTNQCILDIIWFDFVSPIEVGMVFAQQMEYLENQSGGQLMKTLSHYKPPNEPVIKSALILNSGPPRHSNIETVSQIICLLLIVMLGEVY